MNLQYATRPIFLLVVGLVISPVARLLAAPPAEHQQLLDYMERVRDDNDLPGLSVAVAVDGEIVFSGGVGYAELDNRTPQTGRTVHNVGSISKILAVVAVMRLVEQGKLDLDATVQTYLPYYPEKKWPITVRHILTHTSGTRHYNDVEFGEHRLLAMRHYDDFEEATRLWRDDPLLFEPGTLWSYSSHATNLIHGIGVCTSLPTTPHLVVGRSACRVGVGPSLNRSWAQRSRPVVQAGRRAFPGDESVVD